MQKSQALNFDFDDIGTDFSMEELMRLYPAPTVAYRGAIVRGTVVAVDPKVGFWIDFGGKNDGLLPAGKCDNIKMNVGDQANFIVSAPDEELGVILESPQVADTWLRLQERVRSQQPIDVVLGHPVRNGAGVKATVNGLGGFIPHSMLALRSSELHAMFGKTVRVIVEAADPEHSGNLIFNHRKYELQVREQERAELFEKLNIGDVVSGTIVKFADYGAFADIGSGLQGLIHRSHITNDNRKPLGELLHKGQVVRMKVLRRHIEDGGKRVLAFSVKEVKQDEYLAQLQAGSVVSGIVRRKVDFGAFVELSAEHCIDGLIHTSQYSKAIRQGRKTLVAGERVSVKVLSVDPATRRVQLSLRDVAQEDAAGAAPSAG